MNSRSPCLFERCRAFMLAVMVFAVAGAAEASVTLTSYTENATSFEAVYVFTPDITPLDSETSGLGNWSAILTQTYLPAVPLVSPAQYVFNWEGIHLSTPHAGELPILLPTVGLCTIDAASLTGTFCQETVDVPHLLGHHYDQYSFMLELVSGGGYATFTGTHLSAIPVPAAAWLLISGIGGLAAVARRKSNRCA